MTTQNSDGQVSKGKYLVPIVVLMLCAVTLAGTAYAYSTSVTGGGDLNGKYISIDMYDSNGSSAQPITVNLTADDFQIYTERTVATDVSYTAKVVGTTLVYTTYVKILSNYDDTATYTLTATGKYTEASSTSETEKELIKSSISSSGRTITEPVNITDYVTVQDADKNNLKSGTFYKVSISININADTFGTYQSADVLNDMLTKFDGSFTFTLSAELNTVAA